MPIYEFACQECGKTFEARVRVDGRPDACPSCSSTKFDRLLSTFAAHTGSGGASSEPMAACGMGEQCGRVTGRGCGGGMN